MLATNDAVQPPLAEVDPAPIVVLTAGFRDKRKLSSPRPGTGKGCEDGGVATDEGSERNGNGNDANGLLSGTTTAVSTAGASAEGATTGGGGGRGRGGGRVDKRLQMIKRASVRLDDLYKAPPLIPAVEQMESDEETKSMMKEYLMLGFCFLGIMFSFVAYGLLLEYATSGGKKLHELSFLFVTSLVYTLTASAGRYIRAEKPSTIPPAQFAVLGMTSMGSTFCSVRALRYVIFPIQVLAKSCKPVPVMLFGALMGKKYPPKKYAKVALIVGGVGLFMGGGDRGGKNKSQVVDSEIDPSSQMFGIALLFVSLCFDGGTGAYEDKLMSVHSVGPFDLMYNIQLGKTILSGIGLLVLNQVHMFAQMCQDMGFVLVALGLAGAVGQVFIFVTIAKFGALTCSIIGLARKVTTLVASFYVYGHHLNSVQFLGLVVCVSAMVSSFFGKKGGGGHGHGGGEGQDSTSADAHRSASEAETTDENVDEERRSMLPKEYSDKGEVELV